MNELQIAKEVFMSMIKWFLIVLILNNLIWFGIVFKMLSGDDVGMTQIQDGMNNKQEMTNG